MVALDLQVEAPCVICGHTVYRRHLAGAWGAWLHAERDPAREDHAAMAQLCDPPSGRPG